MGAEVGASVTTLVMGAIVGDSVGLAVGAQSSLYGHVDVPKTPLQHSSNDS